MRNASPALIGVALGLACMLAVGDASAQGPYATWRTYGGGVDASQYSALKQIDRSNVSQLEVAWTFPVGERGITFNPIVIDRTMYVSARDNEIVALDAVTGKELWSHPNEGAISARGIDRKSTRLNSSH